MEQEQEITLKYLVERLTQNCVELRNTALESGKSIYSGDFTDNLKLLFSEHKNVRLLGCYGPSDDDYNSIYYNIFFCLDSKFRKMNRSQQKEHINRFKDTLCSILRDATGMFDL